MKLVCYRFKLSLDFLTSAEKKNLIELIEKLQFESVLSDQQNNKMEEVTKMILNNNIKT